MSTYTVSGTVVKFNQVIDKIVHEETFAVSEKKAISNVLYRWKKEHGYTANSAIKLINIKIDEI
jgi:hypothetical protein